MKELQAITFQGTTLVDYEDLEQQIIKIIDEARENLSENPADAMLKANIAISLCKEGVHDELMSEARLQLVEYYVQARNKSIILNDRISLRNTIHDLCRSIMDIPLELNIEIYKKVCLLLLKLDEDVLH